MSKKTPNYYDRNYHDRFRKIEEWVKQRDQMQADRKACNQGSCQEQHAHNLKVGQS